MTKRNVLEKLSVHELSLLFGITTDDIQEELDSRIESIASTGNCFIIRDSVITRICRIVRFEDNMAFCDSVTIYSNRFIIEDNYTLDKCLLSKYYAPISSNVFKKVWDVANMTDKKVRQLNTDALSVINMFLKCGE